MSLKFCLLSLERTCLLLNGNSQKGSYYTFAICSLGEGFAQIKRGSISLGIIKHLVYRCFNCDRLDKNPLFIYEG